jgi:hypothetical protein
VKYAKILPLLLAAAALLLLWQWNSPRREVAPTHPPQTHRLLPASERPAPPDFEELPPLPAAREANALPAPAAATPPPVDPLADHGHIKQARVIDIPPLRDLAREFADSPTGVRLALPHFDDGEMTLRIDTVRPHNDRAAALTGTIEGADLSFFSLSFVGEAQAGSIHLPDRGQVFELSTDATGQTVLKEIDVTALGDCALCQETPP